MFLPIKNTIIYKLSNPAGHRPMAMIPLDTLICDIKLATRLSAKFDKSVIPPFTHQTFTPALARHDLFSIRPVRMYTPDRVRYALRCIQEKGEIWVIAHHGGYLINHYTASYEVTDPKVRAELIELFKRARREEDEIIQREKAKNNE